MQTLSHHVTENHRITTFEAMNRNGAGFQRRQAAGLSPN